VKQTCTYPQALMALEHVCDAVFMPKHKGDEVKVIPYKDTRLTYAQRAILNTLHDHADQTTAFPQWPFDLSSASLLRRGLICRQGNGWIITDRGNTVLIIDKKRRDK
jgi:hypothetical protein